MEWRPIEAVTGGAARRLSEDDRQFRLLADNARVMIWRSGLDKRCNYFNKTWIDFTGRPLPHELGLGWTRGLHPDDYQRCVETFNAAHSGRLPFTMDYHLRRHDGAYRWILSNGVPYYEAGAFAGFLGTCIDISQHQGDADNDGRAGHHDPNQRQSALRELNHRLKNSLQTSISFSAYGRSLADPQTQGDGDKDGRAGHDDPRQRQSALRELNHRLKNSLQTSISFSAYGRSLADPQTQGELTTVTERLSLLALSHEQLGQLDGEPGTGFCGYLESLAEAVHAAVGNSNVRLEVVCEPVSLSAKRASAVGAIIDELLTAALTQRFPEQRCGTVQVESRPLSDRRIELSISDDGLNETLAQARARGSFQRQLVERMIAHANGTIRYELDGGTRCVITLDPD